MSDVYKRGKVYWCYVRINGESIRRSTGQTDKVAARLQKQAWDRLYADPANQAADQTSLASCVSEFLSAKRREQKSPHTIGMYDEKSRHLMRVLGAACRMSSITAPAVDRYIATREGEGASSHSIYKELVTLRGILRVAKRRGEFRGDLSDVLPKFSSGYVPRKTYLTLDQAISLVNHLEPSRGAHVAFVVATGARASEAKRATRSDLRREYIRVAGTKTEKSARMLPAIELFTGLLGHVSLYAPGVGGEGPLFARWPNSRRDIIRACQRAGVPEVTWNDLRRSYASILKQAGVSNDVLADLLGHTSTTMVRRVYGQDTPANLKATLERQLKDGAK